MHQQKRFYLLALGLNKHCLFKRPQQAEEREGNVDELSLVLAAQFEVKSSERYTGCFLLVLVPPQKYRTRPTQYKKCPLVPPKVEEITMFLTAISVNLYQYALKDSTTDRQDCRTRSAFTELFFMNCNGLLKAFPWAGPVHLVILSC